MIDEAVASTLRGTLYYLAGPDTRSLDVYSLDLADLRVRRLTKGALGSTLGAWSGRVILSAGWLSKDEPRGGGWGTDRLYELTNEGSFREIEGLAGSIPAAGSDGILFSSRQYPEDGDPEAVLWRLPWGATVPERLATVPNGSVGGRDWLKPESVAFIRLTDEESKLVIMVGGRERVVHRSTSMLGVLATSAGGRFAVGTRPAGLEVSAPGLGSTVVLEGDGREIRTYDGWVLLDWMPEERLLLMQNGTLAVAHLDDPLPQPAILLAKKPWSGAWSE